MEQRTGSSSQPLEGAGFDPAFIPGLTSPPSAAQATGKPTEAETEAEAAQDTEEERAEHGSTGDGSPERDAPAAEEPGDSGPGDDEAGDDEAVEGPAFEAADRRARIVADHRGVRLSLDDQACEFRWDEIGAVETESPRFGKRFTITVHTPDRRWYPIEIEAKSRSSFEEWERELDAVLDTYFEDGAGEPGDAEADADADADADIEDGKAVDAADTGDAEDAAGTGVEAEDAPEVEDKAKGKVKSEAEGKVEVDDKAGAEAAKKE
ncbi:MULTISPECIES: hypothetical protein [Streptomyces]|uniref:Uncharacterized protein n=1 Tax=Streptomyces doudnae TaxID=3075536 RepID=A0ABD5EII0_9ACTN|nr:MULTISPECIES: hypothetical protein [unclassified Streptomyces]MDT0434406.1 hypothetical protein [Streptomyces sp. DSM 41981]SCD70515.1 hypothetical protein GA0115242_112456 [Streptomyces sp. SolWspMP-5a-2]